MYNPAQKRGPDGRWISTGTRKVRRSVRSAANKKAYAGRRTKKRSTPITINRAASRQQRGVGVSGLKNNFTPQVRISKKSVTIGANTGTYIPGTNKRIVLGHYARIESTNKSGRVDKLTAKVAGKITPEGSKRAALAKHIRKNVKLDNPAIRYAIQGKQGGRGIEARLSTSRSAGPSLIVRRGGHNPTVEQSKSGIRKYDKRMATLSGRKVSKPRPTRRRQAAARKNRKRRN